MADETLTAEVRTRGAREAAREMDHLADQIDDVGGATLGVTKTMGKEGVQSAGMFSRAITLLGTRFGMLIIVVVAAAALLGPGLVAAAALGIAALAALGALIGGVFVLGLGAALVFAQNVNKAGSAAAYLKAQFDGMKAGFVRMVTPGANAVFMGLAHALQLLEPLMKTMRPAFTALGQAMAIAMDIAASSLAGFGPQMRGLLTDLASLLPVAARAVGPFVGVLLDLAVAGIPVLAKLLTWFVKFIQWLRPATQDAIGFEQRTHTLWKILKVTAAVFVWLGLVLADVGRILYGVYIQMGPLLSIIGGAALIVLDLFAKALHYAADNADSLGKVAMVLASGYVLFRLVGVLKILIGIIPRLIWLIRNWRLVMFALNGVMRANPIGAVITVITLLVAGVVLAYHKWGWFHRAVDNVWTFLSTKLIPILKSTWQWIKTAFADSIDFIVPKIEWLIGKLKWIWDHSPQKMAAKVGGGIVDKVTPWDGAVPGFASGGSIRRAGAAVVGERGPELLTLPRGAHVTPNSQLAAAGGGGGTWIAATFVMPDGEVLARQTVKAARRKQSAR
jgi:hypothetical protein